MPETTDHLLDVSHEPVTALKPHPRNYRHHPQDQLDHIAESIREHGFYRNIIASRDGTILAGHGVYLAAKQIGLEVVPVVYLDLDPMSPRALKVLTGDNEIGRTAEVDDRLLSELLKEIQDEDETGLAGTGYDAMMLANLVMVTRPKSEVRSMNEAAEWVGIADYDESAPEPFRLTIQFESEEDRDQFVALTDTRVRRAKPGATTWVTWWPYRDFDDLKSVKFEG